MNQTYAVSTNPKQKQQKTLNSCDKLISETGMNARGATGSTSLPSVGPESRVPIETAGCETVDRKWDAAPAAAGFAGCKRVPQQVASRRKSADA